MEITNRLFKKVGNDIEVRIYLKTEKKIAECVWAPHENYFMVWPYYKKDNGTLMWTDDKLCFDNIEQIKYFCKLMKCKMVSEQEFDLY